jgi:hypothetical protein
MARQYKQPPPEWVLAAFYVIARDGLGLPPEGTNGVVHSDANGQHWSVRIAAAFGFTAA